MSFFKFSKFLSACFSFGILFSGPQADGMNVASPMDGIKLKIPEYCQFCKQEKVDRLVHCHGISSFLCKNDNCIQGCYDEFLKSKGLEPRKLDLNANSVPRCEYFRRNMQKLAKLKKANYECPGMSEQVCKQMCEIWEIFNEDKLADVRFMPCGHSICFCESCCKKIYHSGPNSKIACPKCGVKFDIWQDPRYVFVRSITINGLFYEKALQFFNDKLNGDWRDRVICIHFGDDDAASLLATDFRERGPYYNPDDFDDFVEEIYKLDENRINRVNGRLSLGEDFLVVDARAPAGKALSYLKISNLDDYIKFLIKSGEYGDIDYPVSGELHDKIEAIYYNMIGRERVENDETSRELYTKMLKDAVE